MELAGGVIAEIVFASAVGTGLAVAIVLGVVVGNDLIIGNDNISLTNRQRLGEN